jgi:flagellar biosynthesis/type III secretory pathway M-ring protein FliF/YscJ
VLDDWQKVGADGKVTPLADERQRTSSASAQLVRESIGLKDDRGDQLNVHQSGVQGNGPIAPVEGPPLWQRRGSRSSRSKSSARGWCCWLRSWC